MNTILPKSTNFYQGGSYWGNAIGYESNLAVDRTTSMVIVRDTGSVIVAEWNQAVEDRSVACNYTSRDWAYCAVNALAEFQNSPWGQNRLATTGCRRQRCVDLDTSDRATRRHSVDL